MKPSKKDVRSSIGEGQRHLGKITRAGGESACSESGFPLQPHILFTNMPLASFIFKVLLQPRGCSTKMNPFSASILRAFENC
jgi:hypothetical protein